MSVNLGRGVAVLGDINVDVLMRVPAYPQPGGDALAERLTTQVGGSAANTAVVLARLGLATRLIGRVGQDEWGALALRTLSEAGVDVHHVQRDACYATGLFCIPVTPDGERTMFGHRGANPQTDPAGLAADSLADVQLLHLSGYALLAAPQREAARRAIELAERAGALISLDTGLLPALTVTESIGDLLPRLAICVLGPDEAQALSGIEAPREAALALVRRGARRVGLKLGAEGCWLVDARGAAHIPGFQLQALDTTGAGDAFSAGLIYGCLHGMSLPAMGTLANALGGLATMVLGTGAALPGRAEAAHFLTAHLAGSSGEQRRWLDEVLQALGQRE